MKKDIVIIGGGPSGLSFACSLANSGLNVVIVEKSTIAQLEHPPYDGREIALTHLSADILKEIGVWNDIDQKAISPIKKAKVLDGHSSYSLNFDNNENSDQPLGYLISNHLIRKSLYHRACRIDNIEIIADEEVLDIDIDNSTTASVTLSDGRTIEAALVAAADSRFSDSRRKVGITANMHDFAKVMIVCIMEHANHHANTAFEHFDYDRVLATLPMSGNFSSIVITVDANVATKLANIDEEQFNANISERFNDRLGKMTLSSKRYSYPLVGVHANQFVSNRFALIGDAAVGMHPVTAHGFNLGLSGQSILAKEIKLAFLQGKDVGNFDILEKYQKQHVRDTKPLYLGTNAIVGLFTDNRVFAKIIRSMALRIANSKLLPFKKIITNRLTAALKR